MSSFPATERPTIKNVAFALYFFSNSRATGVVFGFGPSSNVKATAFLLLFLIYSLYFAKSSAFKYVPSIYLYKSFTGISTDLSPDLFSSTAILNLASSYVNFHIAIS